MQRVEALRVSDSVRTFLRSTLRFQHPTFSGICPLISRATTKETYAPSTVVKRRWRAERLGPTADDRMTMTKTEVCPNRPLTRGPSEEHRLWCLFVSDPANPRTCFKPPQTAMLDATTPSHGRRLWFQVDTCGVWTRGLIPCIAPCQLMRPSGGLYGLFFLGRLTFIGHVSPVELRGVFDEIAGAYACLAAMFKHGVPCASRNRGKRGNRH
jgi:hypothetical protein